MEIYNLKHLNQDKRFIVAIVVGFIGSFVFGIISGYLRRIISIGSIDFPVIYWAAAYATAYAIQRFGRGVQPRFAYVGAVCGLLTVLVSDATLYFGIAGAFSLSSYHIVVVMLLRADMFAFLGLLYRAVCVYIGYSYSRII
ncbi:hypothetical protein AOC36_10740 [Erysipelothrix larvae]|uniref:Uncharacterized protein n=1 Tax=Erysipelothrix larvae TaxID=1514105 RepID=A0A0X8H1R6_9FIRM|nr:hypothetical protein [Erysipelothrix larvae]AMC94431.1 hypothetical protein AOC36_10740 [Erysipelothrix larvae]